MMLKLSTAGRNVLKRLEALRLTAYQDAVGIWTIGYGHTAGVQSGDTLPNPEAADAMLSADLSDFEAAINSAVQSCTQLQFDAMCLLAYNIGVAGFLRSTVLKAHNRGDYQSAARAFGLWNQDHHGKILPGLVTRRAEEAAMYLQGSPQVQGEPIDASPDDGPVTGPKTTSRITAGSITAIISTVTATTASISQLTGEAGTTVAHVKEFGLPPLWFAIAAGVIGLGALAYVLYARIDDKLRGFK